MARKSRQQVWRVTPSEQSIGHEIHSRWPPPLGFWMGIQEVPLAMVFKSLGLPLYLSVSGGPPEGMLSARYWCVCPRSYFPFPSNWSASNWGTRDIPMIQRSSLYSSG